MKPITPHGKPQAKIKNKSCASETLEVIEQKYYIAANSAKVDIAKELDYSLANTKLYKNTFTVIDCENKTAPIIEVANETTANAASRLLANGKSNLVALNFASATTPGGGFLNGAQAQEEDLCRCSGLYPCIKSQPSFYNRNIMQGDQYYTDAIIYSPDVPFFRDSYLNFLDTPFLLSIITSPAPNVSSMPEVDFNPKKLELVLKGRIRKILQVAAINNHKTLVLGAFGCGAFGNNAELVASYFRDELVNFSDFEHVCFAVYDTRPNQEVFQAFKNVFAK